MRVALITNLLAPYRVPLFEALQSRLGSLDVLVSSASESDRSWGLSTGCLRVHVQRTVSVRRGARSQGLSPRTDLHLPLDTYFQLRRLRPDVVVTAELGLRTALTVIYAVTHPRTRLVIWATLSEWTERHRSRRRWLRRVLLGRADLVLVNGASGARYIRALRPDAPVVVLHQASPTGRGPSGRRIGEAPVTGSMRLTVVSRLEPYKGVATWLRAFLRSDECQGVEVVIAGDGSERQQVEDLASSSDRCRVHVEGEVPPERVEELLSSSQALVFPTLGDEWGLVVNEALALGVPVIGSVYSQAVTELVADGRNGWHFDPLVPGAFNEALRQLKSACDGGGRPSLAAAARESVAQLSIEAMAQRFHQALMQVSQP